MDSIQLADQTGEHHSNTSIHDGTNDSLADGSNLPELEAHQISSTFIESMVICNEVDVENELSKVKGDANESVFKILSMSFYDKSLSNRPFQTHNPSPARFDEVNRTFGSTSKGPTPKGSKIHINLDLKSKHSTPKGDAATLKTKPKTATSSKTHIKSDVKLYSIKEKATDSLLPPNLTSEKIHLGSLVNMMGPKLTKAHLKSQPKPDTIRLNPRKSPSPRNRALKKESASPEKGKDSIVTENGPSLTKLSSPNRTPKKPILRPNTSDKINKVALTLSPRPLEPRIRTNMTPQKPKLSREVLSSMPSPASERKNIVRINTPLRSASPNSLLIDKTILIDIPESRQTKDLASFFTQPKETKGQSKISKLPENKMQKLKDALSQQPQSLQVNLTKNISKTKPPSKNISQEYKSQKAMPTQKVYLQTHGASEPKLNLKKASNAKTLLQGVKEFKEKNSNLILTTSKPRELESRCHTAEPVDSVKLYLKPQSKGHSKGKLKDSDLKRRGTPILSIQN